MTLQRYDLSGSSTDSSNWRSAASSPGVESAITRKDFDAEIRNVRATKNGSGFFVEVTVYAKRKSEQDDDPAENDGELFVGHSLESFFAASRSSTMMEKAISDKSGTVMKPTNSSFCAEQDTPLPQGCRVAGMNPP